MNTLNGELKKRGKFEFLIYFDNVFICITQTISHLPMNSLTVVTMSDLQGAMSRENSPRRFQRLFRL